ncbi:MAG TPA: SLAC1 anion channel family protein [Candidatus Nanopelagicales bacterium]|nr:SLAC1 anion channel family protein [Candidatus Nanopelagicales bacterium]
MTRPLVVAADIASPAANAVDARPRPADGWLAHLPVSLFASVMGIGGLSLAWRRAAATQLAPEWIGQALFWFALAVFVALVALYAAKWAVRPAAALNEARHPIKMPFLSTITIAVLVLATAGSELMPVAAQAMWWIGAIGQLALTIGIVSAWFSRPEIVPTMVTPAWFIPVVGNIVTPLAARAVGSLEFAWLAFGVGITFWVGLLPLVLQRLLLAETPLPLKLTPTLAIAIAPPAVALLSWQSLTGEGDAPATRVLFGAMLAFLALLLAQVRLLRNVPFGMPYWAYTFPLAAAAAASVAVAAARPYSAYTALAWALLVLSSTVVAAVGALTLRAAVRREICVPE